ncbi:MAG TPA: hypothetical protein VK249_29920 [Anaerolineales bacterium]|nr:hypothetical protein [Anaerolineales bacterium]
MAMRTATMDSMGPMDSSPTVRESDSLFRKLVLLLLLISAAVLWVVVWYQYETIFPLLLSTFFADVSLGLVAGFGSRFILRNREPVIRYLVAILIAVTGMVMIGFLTHSVLGIGPFRLEQKFAEQIRAIRFNPNLGHEINSLHIGSRVLFDFSKMDWADPVHLAISLAIAVLSLQAWPHTTPASEPVELTPLPVTPPPATRSRRGRRSTSSANGRARVQRPASSSARQRSSAQNAQPQPRVRSNNGTRATVRGGVKKVKEPTVRPKKKRLFHRRPKIQLALVEEHRCPYCLDAVSRNDPRGVKECEVCHTLHHADCWAITGMCQVPHLNT